MAYFSCTHDAPPPTKFSSSSLNSSLLGSTSSDDQSRREDSNVDSMPSSSEEESSECDREVMWEYDGQRVHLGFGAWGMCLMENCISLMIYLRKSGSLRFWHPKRKRWLPPRQEQSKPPNRLVRMRNWALNELPKPGAAHPVPVIQTKHVQQFNLYYSRSPPPPRCPPPLGGAGRHLAHEQ